MTTVVEAVPAVAAEAGNRERAERFYRPELDALRFFAFLGVFIFHAAPRTMDFYNAAGYPHWLSSLLIPMFRAGAYGGFIFALSAYLITACCCAGAQLRGRWICAAFTCDASCAYGRFIWRLWLLLQSQPRCFLGRCCR
jgi:peptidoglycan/LPS O-acetylase OafA/YrhL